MLDTFTVLLADRNPHVRQFLRRELVAEGYNVLVAKDGREVLVILDAKESADILVLDLDMPHVNGLRILGWLKQRGFHTPVIVHTYHTEHINHPAVRNAAAFIEKTGNNIDGFKAVVARSLRASYPDRFGAIERRRHIMTSKDRQAEKLSLSENS